MHLPVEYVLTEEPRNDADSEKISRPGGITGHGGRPSSIATLDIYTSCLKRVGMVHGTFLPPAFPCEWKDNDQRRRE